MKRFVNVIAFMLFMVGIKAQVRDAFDGILPVTDPQMKRSLNGNSNKKTEVKYEILDANRQIVGTTKVEHPHLWTAETPYLYTLRTTLCQKEKALQVFEHKFGFHLCASLPFNGTDW